jgi:hypothetical protein
MLAGLLPARGIGAPSARASAFALAAALALLVPAAASAHFVRPFLHQTSGTCQNAGETPPACSGFTPFSTIGPLGLAVDAGGELWAGDVPSNFKPPFPLDRFQPSGAFQEALPLSGAQEAPRQLAIDPATGAFYVGAGQIPISGFPGEVEILSAAGTLQHTIGISELGDHTPRSLAFDPSTGSLYVVNASTGQATVFKFDATGAKASFAGCPSCSEYVSGNEITGAPGANKLSGENGGLAVDPASGDIYVFTDGYAGQGAAILEYAPSGEFLRAITSQGVPRPPGDEQGGFGGTIQGLAVDPTNGDLLASIPYNIGTLNRGAIDEFDSSGHFLGQITEAAGRPLIDPRALALDSAGGLYVSDTAQGGRVAVPEPGEIDAYGPGHFVPALRLAEPTQRHPESAVLGGAVNPESATDPDKPAGLADCRFEYTTETEWRSEGFSGPGVTPAPCVEPDAAEIGEADSYVPVHAAIAGLTSGTTYRYRLSATLEGALGGQPEHSAALAFTAPHAPAVSATAANQITSTFADLLATVNPLGADTTYRFEYLTQEAYEADGGSFGPGTATAPVPPADIGPGGPTGSSPEAVLQHLGALQPATAYRFRLTAENEIGATVGEEATFTTLAAVSPGLPDNRAYELLTPPDKEGAEDLFREELGEDGGDQEKGLASESGDQVLLGTRAAFGPFPASGGNVYAFSRRPTPGGPQPARWDLTSLASPALGVQSVLLPGAYDPADFSRLAFIDNVGATESPGGRVPTALLGPPGGPYATLHTEPGLHQGNPGEFTQILGGSRDFGHLVFETTDHSLAPAAAALDPGASALYEWEQLDIGGCTSFSSGFSEASGGCFALLDVKSNGEEPLSPCGAGLGEGGDEAGTALHAVSADGSRVFLTAPAPWTENSARRGLEAEAGCPDSADTVNPPQLYLRSAGETLEVSAPQATLAKEKKKFHARYAGAAADGSRAFFISEAWLTADHPAAHDPELYEWRLPGVPGSTGPGNEPGPCEESSPAWVPASQGCLTRVSRAQSAAEPGHVGALAALPSGGSAVYFLADGVLASSRGADGTLATPGHCDQVLGQAGMGGTCNLYRYDTATAATTYIATVNNLAFRNRALDGRRASRPRPDTNWTTTPDGRYLLFKSNLALTAYSNADSVCRIDLSGGENFGPCAELYRYDAQTGSLLCVSCDPSGAPPASNAIFTQSAATSEVDASYGTPRAISDDGAYVFFDTADPLVPQDSNGTWDVYQWHQGRISLLSSGTDAAPAFFLDAGPDGSNVFFGTHARLVPQDTDGKGDLYDARICTAAEPCISAPPGREGLCEGDACSHPVPAPNDPTPGSLTYNGAGNEHPKSPHRKPCPKGKVRRGGAKGASKSDSSATGAKTKHLSRHGKCVAKRHKKHHASKHKRANHNRRAGK